MDVQMTKGILDALVLAVVAREDTYGYKLIADTSQVITVSESTLYPVLRRLESQSLVRTYHQQHNGRLRKYYAITPAGDDFLQDYKHQWQQTKRVIDYVFEGSDGRGVGQ